MKSNNIDDDMSGHKILTPCQGNGVDPAPMCSDLSYKKCSKCGEVKTIIDEFYKNSTAKDEYSYHCIQCDKEKVRNYRMSNRKKMAVKNANWRKENPEKQKEIERNYRKKNKEKLRERSRCYYKLNPQKRLASGYLWRKNNLERVRANRRKDSKKRVSTLKGYLDNRIRCLIWTALRKNKEGRSWKELVDYTLDDLKKHLEKQFKKGMSWKLFTQGKIHIDHKIPISAFNFTKPEHIDFKRCWALSNLQPLWAKENLIKNDKLNKPFQPSLAI